jgi:hypothetical protein
MRKETVFIIAPLHTFSSQHRMLTVSDDPQKNLSKLRFLTLAGAAQILPMLSVAFFSDNRQL